jgi:hypothetical protein
VLAVLAIEGAAATVGPRLCITRTLLKPLLNFEDPVAAMVTGIKIDEDAARA